VRVYRVLEFVEFVEYVVFVELAALNAFQIGDQTGNHLRDFVTCFIESFEECIVDVVLVKSDVQQRLNF
jgi:hypothetical protein